VLRGQDRSRRRDRKSIGEEGAEGAGLTAILSSLPSTEPLAFSSVVNKPASDEETRERRQSKDAFDPLIGQADWGNSETRGGGEREREQAAA